MLIIVFPLMVFAQPVLSLTKLRDLLYQSHPQQVVRYRDDLGEGKGSFDFDPRMDWSKVNCTTWWQQLLAKSYAHNDREELETLDRIRYYDGVVGFSTRKHFLDRALLLDPQPFLDIASMDIPACTTDVQRMVRLDLSLFSTRKGFSCPLYREEVDEISFQYFSPNALLQCVPHIPAGVYMIFPVASIRYNEIWGKESGPMGRVHGLFLDKEGTYAQVFHASITKKKVVTTSLQKYVESLDAALFDGYQLYQISSTISPSQPFRAHEEAISCEQRMIKKNTQPITP